MALSCKGLVRKINQYLVIRSVVFLLVFVSSEVLLQSSVPSCARKRCPSCCRMTFHLSTSPRKPRPTRKMNRKKSVSFLVVKYFYVTEPQRWKNNFYYFSIKIIKQPPHQLHLHCCVTYALNAHKAVYVMMCLLHIMCPLDVSSL